MDSVIGTIKLRVNGKKDLKEESNKDKFNYTVTDKDLLKTLPFLLEVFTTEEQESLFVRKLKLCSINFDFTLEAGMINKTFTGKLNPQDVLAKHMKVKILEELIDFISQPKTVISQDMLKPILQMVEANMFRSLPESQYPDNDDPDDLIVNPVWPHLALVYEFLYRFIASIESSPQFLNIFLSNNFIISLLDLFDSEDPRERDYLRTILHKIYAKFPSYRIFIRSAITNVLYKIIYEKEQHNGIPEILEILGSIIDGFTIPLRKTHQRFLCNVLIPLHKVRALHQFSEQLTYCITQFIEKDPDLCSVVIGGMLKFWPAQSSQKEILFLDELEDVLSLVETEQFEEFIEPLFKRVAEAICSPHFQVARRALLLWNNSTIAKLIFNYREKILPIIHPALYQNTTKHWNTTVLSLTVTVVHLFIDMDNSLYRKVYAAHEAKLKDPMKRERDRKKKWAQIRALSSNVTA